MNDADCIFGESGTYLAEMFKDGSQQSNAVNNLIPSGFAKAAGKATCTLIVSFAQFISRKGFIRFAVFPNGEHTGIRSCAIVSVRKQGTLNIPARMRIKMDSRLLFLISTPPVVLFLTIDHGFIKQSSQMLTATEVYMRIIVVCHRGFGMDEFCHTAFSAHCFKHIPECNTAFSSNVLLIRIRFLTPGMVRSSPFSFL